MRLFDTHAHLHFPELLADLDAVLDRARAAGVAAMVTVGTDRETNPAAVALAERLPGVFASVGIHPHDAGEATDADYAAMEALARDSPKVVALGEMGLDFFRNLSPPDVQVSAFRRQLRLARRVGKPVVLHVRDAHEEALAILAEERVARRRRCDALLLGRRRRGPALSRPRSLHLARGSGDVQERARPARRGALRAGGPTRRGDRLPVPAARAAPRPAQRAGAREP